MAVSSAEDLRAAIEAAPDDPHCYNAMALHLLTVESKPDEAESMYKTALSKDPVHLESLANYGVFMAQIRGENGEARKLFQRALKAAPGNPEVLSSLASLAHLEGDLPTAEKLYKQVFAADPNHVSSLLNFALLLTSQRRLDEARAEYEKALELDKSGSACHQYAVFCQTYKEDTSTARAMFKRSYEINRENTGLLVDYATFSERVDKDHDLAEQLYSDCLGLEENHATCLANYGLFQMNVRKNKKLAQAFLQRAVELEPTNVTFLKNLGAFHYEMKGDAAAALKLFEKSLREGNKLKPAKSTASMKSDTAAGDVGPDADTPTGDADGHDADFDDELAPPGDDPETLGHAALASIDLRRYDDAEEFFRRGIKASANDPVLLCNYALFLKDVRKEYDAAAMTFRRAIAADTDHITTALSGYAMLQYHVVGDKEEAEAQLARALEVHPNDADVLANYGSVLLEKSGNIPAPDNTPIRFKAYDLLQRAFEIDATHPGANAALGHYYYAIDPQPERALSHLDAALDRNPKSTDALMSLALLHTHVTNEEAKAERYYKQLLQVDPNNVNALLAYASFTQAVKDKPKRAAMLFEKALVAGPSDPSANNSMACFLIDEKRDLDRAEALLKKAVEADPKYVPGLANLALLFVRLKRDSEAAMTYYERAIEAAGKSISAKLAAEFAIFLHLTAKEYDRAEAMYEQALSIDPEYEDAIVHYSKFLKDIRRNPAQANAMYNRKRELQKRKTERPADDPAPSLMSREVSHEGTSTTALDKQDGDKPPLPSKPAPPPGRPEHAVPSPRAKQLAAGDQDGQAKGEEERRGGGEDDKDESKDSEDTPSDDKEPVVIPGDEDKPKIPLRIARRGMQFNPNRRQSVSAEVLGRFFGHTQTETKKIPKTPEQEDQIQKSIGRNMLFAHLEDEQKKEVTDAMFEVKKNKGDVIIKQGDDGDNFYVLAEGTCDVSLLKQGETLTVGTIHPGGSFGELALMYNTPRAATITANEPCILWAVDRTTFRRILLISTLNRRRQYEDFLGRVPILADLTPYEKSSLADAITGQTVHDGEVIVKQGDAGEAFFLVIDGEVLITRKENALAPEQTIGTVKTGEYFGEIALLTDAPRQATVTAVGTCKLARLEREAFDRLLGPCLDVLRRNIGQYEAIISQGLDRPDGNTGTTNETTSPGRAAAPNANVSGGDDDEGIDVPVPEFTRKRKGGVSAEAMGRFQEDHKSVVVDKDTQSIDRIHRMLEILKERNFLFRDLDAEQERSLVDAVYEEKKERGEYVIRQGEQGDHFYMLAEGQCQVLISSKPGEKPKKFGDLVSGDTFGELALMYNCPRAASIVAVTPVSLWVLDRSTFRHVLQDSAIEKRRRHESFLETVPLFQKLSAYEKTTIADSLFHRTVPAGTKVYAQGDKAQYFYFVVEGSAIISRNEEKIKEVGVGDHFGEDGLLGDATSYYATVTAAPSDDDDGRGGGGGGDEDNDLKVFYMDRSAFKRVLPVSVEAALKSRVVTDFGHSALVARASPSKPTIMLGANLSPGSLGGSGSGGGGGGLLAPNPALFASRRKSVSAEVMSRQMLEQQQSAILPEVPKTDGQIQQLRKACLKNFLFSGLDTEQLNKAMKVMFEVKHPAGAEIITQGDDGDNFYVLAQGKCEVKMERAGETKSMGIVEPGGSFGELALMYNTPRAATVSAVTDVTLWAIDRQGFRQLILGSSLQKRRQYEEFMDHVPLFKTLNPYERSTIADAFVEEHFDAGETVFRQGAVGDKFYIVVRGEAVVTSQESSFVPEQEIKRLKRGDYFGEIALLQDKGRLFAVRASNDEQLTVCSLGRDAFKRLLGPLKLILQRNTEVNYSDEVRQFLLEALGGVDVEDVNEALNQETDYESEEETDAYESDSEAYATPRDGSPQGFGLHTINEEDEEEEEVEEEEATPEATEAEKEKEDAKLASRAQHRQGRRQGVSAEVMGRFFDEKTEIKVIPKTDEQVAQIQRSIAGSFLFSSLDDKEVKEVTDAMFEVRHGPREDIIKQGDDGDNFYVVAEGTCEALISKGGAARKVAEIGPGGSFGELALMYNTPRAATVRSVSDVVLWAVDRTTFRRCVLTSTINKRKLYEEFLAAVPIFESLTPYERAQLADAFQTVNYEDGEAIVTQGDAGDTFFVLVEGECKIEHQVSAEATPVDVGRIHKGRYFGELALITNRPRAVTIRALGPCKLVALARDAFDSLLGPIIDVLKRNADSYESLKDSSIYKAALSEEPAESPSEVSSKIVESAKEGAKQEAKQEVLTAVLPRAMFDPRARRSSVSAEVLGRFFRQEEEPVAHYPKTAEQTDQIERSIKTNFLFQGLDDAQLEEVIGSMFEVKKNKGEVVMKQGDDGDNFYVLASGACRVDISKQGVETHVGDVLPGGSFGELALMYNTPRAATITCTEDCVLWAVDRVTFRRILLISTLNKRKNYEIFLSKVPILQSLEPYERSTLADAFISVDIAPNERVVAQGDSGDQFYVIEKGEFIISHRPDRNAGEVEIGRLGPGDYFGEVSLLTTKPRAASITSVGPAKVVALSRGAFTRLLGPCVDILKRNVANYTELKTTGDYKDALQNAIEFETESGESPADTRPQSELAVAAPVEA